MWYYRRMNEYQERRRLAWEEFANHSIEPLNPATALAYQSLFYAGYDAAFSPINIDNSDIDLNRRSGDIDCEY